VEIKYEFQLSPSVQEGEIWRERMCKKKLDTAMFILLFKEGPLKPDTTCESMKQGDYFGKRLL